MIYDPLNTPYVPPPGEPLEHYAPDIARHRLLDTILRFFGGRAQPMMQQLVEAAS